MGTGTQRMGSSRRMRVGRSVIKPLFFHLADIVRVDMNHGCSDDLVIVFRNGYVLCVPQASCLACQFTPARTSGCCVPWADLSLGQ